MHNPGLWLLIKMNLQGFIKREKGSKGAHLTESSHEEGLPGFRNHNSQEVLIERRFVLGFCWKENSYKEQIEAKNLFSSEEDEEQAKKEFAKTFVPGEAPSIPEDPKEEQAPKPVAPTPEQIITIKVSSTLYLFSLFLLVHRFHIFNELRLNPKLEW
ncbi:uncharacterized protein LOC114279652 isoform X2 [Camellia sinensis]|uniref:uncharacterized protein LOC114279652 isoform X2 n=1 Tax=Camellia sinensis TaxID=4442 RepID=UPI0010368472|nr:uncharacterized protein LOC114279652 isoform X2 [Camellia sinensis]